MRSKVDLKAGGAVVGLPVLATIPPDNTWESQPNAHNQEANLHQTTQCDPNHKNITTTNPNNKTGTSDPTVTGPSDPPLSIKIDVPPPDCESGSDAGKTKRKKDRKLKSKKKDTKLKSEKKREDSNSNDSKKKCLIITFIIITLLFLISLIGWAVHYNLSGAEHTGATGKSSSNDSQQSAKPAANLPITTTTTTTTLSSPTGSIAITFSLTLGEHDIAPQTVNLKLSDEDLSPLVSKPVAYWKKMIEDAAKEQGILDKSSKYQFVFKLENGETPLETDKVTWSQVLKGSWGCKRGGKDSVSEWIIPKYKLDLKLNGKKM